MKKEARRWTLGYAAVQCFFWINFVTVSGYASVYLLDVGLTNGEIGILIGAAGVLAAMLQPAVGAYADRPSAVSVKVIVLISSVVTVILSLLVILLYGHSKLLVGLLFAGCIVILEFLVPFVTSLGSEVISQGIPINWGLSRAAGSMAFAVMSSVIGILTAKTGVICIPICIAAGFAILIGCVCIYPFHKQPKAADPAGQAQAAAPNGSPIAFFRKYPRFLILLIGIILAYTSHMFLNTFLFQIVESKGGSSIEMGRIMTISAIAEIFPLLFFSFMLKKAGSDTWLRVSGVFVALKALGTLLAPSISALYVVALLQILAWGLLAVAPVYYVKAVIAEEDAIKGQAYMAMTYTLGCVVASVLGGAILDYSGVRMLLVGSVLTGAIGAVIMFGFSDRLGKR